MATPHVGKTRTIKIERPNHIMHPGLVSRAQARHTADSAVHRVSKQPLRVFGAWIDKPGEIILITFVMAAMPVSLCAAVTGASQVGVLESPSWGTIGAVARLEMLDVAVCRFKASFAITAKMLLFCLQHCLDGLIRGCIVRKIIPCATTALPRQQLGWRCCFRVRSHRFSRESQVAECVYQPWSG